MSKYFMYGIELQEFEKLMMLVPNFLLRRSGVIIQKKLQNKNESIRCPDCNYFIDSQSREGICAYFGARAAAGVNCYETIVKTASENSRHTTLKEMIQISLMRNLIISLERY